MDTGNFGFSEEQVAWAIARTEQDAATPATNCSTQFRDLAGTQGEAQWGSEQGLIGFKDRYVQGLQGLESALASMQQRLSRFTETLTNCRNNVLSNEEELVTVMDALRAEARIPPAPATHDSGSLQPAPPNTNPHLYDEES